MPAMGSNAILSICRQNSMGATMPSSWWQIPFASHGLNFTYGELTDDSIQSTADLPDRAIGIGGFQGPIEFNLFPLPAGMFLRGLFGGYSVSAVGSAFKHVFNPNTTAFGTECTLPPYAFQVDPGEPGVSSAYLYRDGFVTAAEISLSAGGYARTRFDILGKAASLITKASGAAINQTGAAPLKWSGASLSIGGAGVQRFGSISFGFDNKITPVDRIAGALEHTYFYRDGFREFGRVSGTVDVAQADWLDFIDAKEQQLILTVQGVTSISSGVNELFKIDIPRFVYTVYPIGVAGPGIVTAAIEGRAQYSQASKTVCTITMQNTFASYSA